MQLDEEWITAQLDQAPPLSAGQRDQIAMLFGSARAAPLSEVA